jgi:hypothetical protein
MTTEHLRVKEGSILKFHECSTGLASLLLKPPPGVTLSLIRRAFGPGPSARGPGDENDAAERLVVDPSDVILETSTVPQGPVKWNSCDSP